MNQKHMYRSQKSRRGSALITAVIFSFIIGALAVTFLKLASNEYRASVRSTLYASSLNLAESGVEMGINALATDLTSGSTWTTTSTGFLTDAAYTGDVKVVILNASSRAPTIYAEGEINGHPSGAVTKQVRVELSSGFAPYETGFSARNGITFSGRNVLLDSYNSNYGAYGAALTALGNPPVGYGYGGDNINSDITVASDSLSSSDGVTVVDAGNGTIYGNLHVSENNTYTIGPRGAVTGYGEARIANHEDNPRISEDFYADFPVETYPTGGTSLGTISNGTTLTEAMALGTEASPKVYSVDAISMGGSASNILTVSGHVVLVMDGDIAVNGSASINIVSGGSLTVYTQNDVAIAGNGISNGNDNASSFSLYGTALPNGSGDSEVAAQSISISGNGQLLAAVYAPTADVTLNGGGTNGQVMGGVVAYSAKLNGGSSFHFDEALREIINGGGGYSIESWLEMTGATAASTPIDMSAY